MDQNADGVSDENPLTTPFTGLTPGDVYAVPAPDPVDTGHLWSRTLFQSLSLRLNPNSRSLLIVPGPQISSTQVVATTGTVSTNNLVLNGTTDSFDVTFDRPMQAATFTPADVLQIMGPTGAITGPQYFSNSAVDQSIPKATPTVPGMLSQTADCP